ncbi:MAG TPA: hypothetical protein VF733_04055 [Candidatus Saccharimonadales bacterium]
MKEKEIVNDEIAAEISRQNEKWGAVNTNLPDDRWLEIATDEFNDLKWAVRTRNEVEGHTIAKERTQLIAVLVRWAWDETEDKV